MARVCSPERPRAGRGPRPERGRSLRSTAVSPPRPSRDGILSGPIDLDGPRRTPIRQPIQRAKPPKRPTRTASGSFTTGLTPARVALASRIWVEGTHDAVLVERIWGDDLRAEGVVVEQLEGADQLADHVRAFAPTAERRLGVLLDHLVEGTKE